MSFTSDFNYNRNEIFERDNPVRYLYSDLYNEIHHAYGFRKFLSGFNGYCCRIKRSSDDALADFKFDANEVLSLNSTGYHTTTQASLGTLSSWIGSNDGHLEILYDQGFDGIFNTAVNLVRYTGYIYGASNQIAARSGAHTDPLIVSGGQITTRQGKPAAILTGSGVMLFQRESDPYKTSSPYLGTPKGLQGTNGHSTTFLVGSIDGTGLNRHMEENDTKEIGGDLFQHTSLIGGHIQNYVEDISIGVQSVDSNNSNDRRYLFYYEASQSNAITGMDWESGVTKLFSSFTDNNTAGFKISDIKYTGVRDGSTAIVTPRGMAASQDPKYIHMGGPGSQYSASGAGAGSGSFSELLFSTGAMSESKRILVEAYMASYFNTNSVNVSDVTASDKVSATQGGTIDIFTPSYGSSIEFNANNTSWYGSSYYNFIMPNGLNSLKASINLKFIEPKITAHNLIKKIEGHTTGVLTGNAAFSGTNSFINFDAITNSEAITFDSTYYKSFSGSQLDSWSIKPLSNNNYEINLKLTNNRVSTVLNNGMGFVKDSTKSLSSQPYSQFDVALGETGTANPKVMDNYFYLTGSRSSAITPGTVGGLATYTGFAHDCTRTFFFHPDLETNLSWDYSNRKNVFKQSFEQTLNLSNNQNYLRSIDLTFSNRGEKETYAILHFLETHLGYKHFVYEYDDDIINQKRVFYCPRWQHTFNYQGSNTIKARFVEVANPTVPQFSDEVVGGATTVGTTYPGTSIVVTNSSVSTYNGTYTYNSSNQRYEKNTNYFYRDTDSNQTWRFVYAGSNTASELNPGNNNFGQTEWNFVPFDGATLTLS